MKISKHTARITIKELITGGDRFLSSEMNYEKLRLEYMERLQELNVIRGWVLDLMLSKVLLGEDE